MTPWAGDRTASGPVSRFGTVALMRADEAKTKMCDEVDRRAAMLLDASRQIHAHPELNFEEHHAHDLLAGVIEKEGIPVERHAYGLDTAFEARAGDQGPTVAVLCEYDALPGIGHACGHNIIATAGLGAGLAAAALADEIGGRVVILGTPAEEGGGGKIIMAERGALEGIDAAMMVHPAGDDLDSMTVVAVRQVVASYRGSAAHAAAAPEKGRNALDAAVLGYMNVAALRQHIRVDERVHGVFTDAGDKPSIVPEKAAAHWFVRAGRLEHLEDLCARVEDCLRSGASAAGCEIDLDWDVAPTFSELRSNRAMAGRYVDNAATLGRSVRDHRRLKGIVGSTDMGNVSLQVPSIHPMIKVSPVEVAIHTADFADWAASDDGDRAVLDGAKAMAMTVADLWLDADLMTAVRAEFADVAGASEAS